jgi:hypothetical protein
MATSYYAVLGLEPQCTASEIIRAYKITAYHCHPWRANRNDLKANIEFQLVRNTSPIIPIVVTKFPHLPKCYLLVLYVVLGDLLSSVFDSTKINRLFPSPNSVANFVIPDWCRVRNPL